MNAVLIEMIADHLLFLDTAHAHDEDLVVAQMEATAAKLHALPEHDLSAFVDGLHEYARRLRSAGGDAERAQFVDRLAASLGLVDNE